MYQKPFLKWVGGKTQIIDEVMSTNYHEIFLGGGSVLLALLTKHMNKQIKINGKIFAYDHNTTLINLFKDVKNNFDSLYSELKKLDTNTKRNAVPINIKGCFNLERNLLLLDQKTIQSFKRIN